MERKIIAKQVPPEHMDTSSFFNGDWYAEEAGENCVIYLWAPDGGINAEYFKRHYDNAVSLFNYFLDCDGEEKDYHDEARENATKEEFARIDVMCDWYKNTLHDIYNEVEATVSYLSALTGKTWNSRFFTGYYQGSCCYVIYCEETNTPEDVKLFGSAYLGQVAEFSIDEVYGYFVEDGAVWSACCGDIEPLRNTLSEQSGYKPEELTILLYDGEERIAKYKEV